MYYALKSLTDDTDFIMAEDVKATEQSDDYYCPCPTCKCKFGFRSFNSNKKKNCFFKLPSSVHTDSCFVPYVKSKEGNKYDYEMKTLTAEGLLLEMENSTKMKTVRKNPQRNKEKSTSDGKAKRKPLSTLRQLYYICASNEPSTELNNSYRVIDLFAGRNTAYLYTKYINGIKLVECQFLNQYKSESKTLFFSYPYKGNNIRLSVGVENNLLFKKLRNQLWQFDRPVIIYAKWDNSHCTIKSSKQVVPIK